MNKRVYDYILKGDRDRLSINWDIFDYYGKSGESLIFLNNFLKVEFIPLVKI